MTFRITKEEKITKLAARKIFADLVGKNLNSFSPFTNPDDLFLLFDYFEMASLQHYTRPRLGYNCMMQHKSTIYYSSGETYYAAIAYCAAKALGFEISDEPEN